MRSTIFGLSMLAFLIAGCASSSHPIYSPGIKIGWRPSEGFSLGAELSYLQDVTPSATGLVMDLDVCATGRIKLHVGGQFAIIETGPTLSWYKGDFIPGLNFTAFAPLPFASNTYMNMMPYLFGTLTFNFHGADEREVGTYVKFYPPGSELKFERPNVEY